MPRWLGECKVAPEQQKVRQRLHRIGTQTTQVPKPAAVCEPSQKGLVPDCPQRHT